MTASKVAGLDVNMSAEEVDKMAKHMQDPEFCRLLAEYAKDIEDPQARAEQEAYLTQLEAQGELEGVYGQGVQIIQAEPGMVVKTKTADGSTRVYINICTCPKVGKMVVEQSTSGRRGCSITLPNIMSAKGNREGKAPDGGTFKTWDSIVHPDTLPQCSARMELMHNLIMMAIEKVEESAGVKLLRKYKLPSVRYKGVDGEQRPPVLLHRTTEEGNVVDGHLRPLCNPSSGPRAEAAAGGAAVTAATEAAASSKDAAHDTSKGRSSFSFGSKAKPPNTSRHAAGSQDTAPTSPDRGAPPGVVTPEYQVVERARVDLGNAWSDTGRALQLRNTPEALVVRVQLPGVTSAAGVQLSLAADSVALEVPGKYQLQLPLKHKVSEQQATAKFITSKHTLVLTLPVLQPAAQQQLPSREEAPREQQQHANQPSQAHNSPLQKLPSRSAESEEAGSQADMQSVPPAPVADSPSPLAGPSSSSSSSSSDMQQAGSTGSTPVSPPAQPAKTDNQRKWEALHKQHPPSDGGVSQQPQQQTQPAASPAQEREVPHQDQQLSAPAAPQVAVPLRPRLASRRVTAADFV